jgi:hypothetical protein
LHGRSELQRFKNEEGKAGRRTRKDDTRRGREWGGYEGRGDQLPASQALPRGELAALIYSHPLPPELIF